MANTISGLGILRAVGGDGGSGSGVTGGAGRIRVEANTIDLVDLGQPAWTASLEPDLIFPEAKGPTLTATMIGNETITLDPAGGIGTAEVVIVDSTEVTLEIQAANVPLGTTVQVIGVNNTSVGFSVTSSPLAGAFESSTATATLTLPPGRSEIILRANWTP